MTSDVSYRQAVAVEGTRRALRRVRLAGAPLFMQRALGVVRVAAASTAAAALFAPWHEVSDPVGGAVSCQRGAEGLEEAARLATSYHPPFICTGHSHLGSVRPIALLAVIIALSCVLYRRRGVSVAMAIAAAQVSLLVALFYDVFNLKHLFAIVEPLPGEAVFHGAGMLLAVVIAAEFIATPILYLWARAKLPRI